LDKPEIAKASLNLKPYFITAIGHEQNVPLLQKVADKSFITPTALGQYFREIYNLTIEQLQNSKAELVNNISKQLEGAYRKQIENLEDKIANQKEISNKEAEFYKQQLFQANQDKAAINVQFEELQSKMGKPGQLPLYIWLLLIAALVLGWFLARV